MYGESGILSVMHVIMNYDTRLLYQHFIHLAWILTSWKFSGGETEIVTWYGTRRFLAEVYLLEEVTWCKLVSGERIKVLCVAHNPLPTLWAHNRFRVSVTVLVFKVKETAKFDVCGMRRISVAWKYSVDRSAMCICWKSLSIGPEVFIWGLSFRANLMKLTTKLFNFIICL